MSNELVQTLNWDRVRRVHCVLGTALCSAIDGRIEEGAPFRRSHLEAVACQSHLQAPPLAVPAVRSSMRFYRDRGLIAYDKNDRHWSLTEDGRQFFRVDTRNAG